MSEGGIGMGIIRKCESGKPGDRWIDVGRRTLPSQSTASFHPSAGSFSKVDPFQNKYI